MSYEKHTWTNGEVITADKLNHIEGGIAEGGSVGGSLVINTTMEGTTETFDKTCAEVLGAFLSGSPCIIVHAPAYEGDSPRVSLIYEASGDDQYGYAFSDRNATYNGSTENDYPHASFD